MKATKHSLIYNNHIDTLNELADFLLRELKVDIRLQTKSKKNDLAKYRSIFFNIYLSTYSIDLASLGSYLNKDHSTVVHSTKMWHRELSKDFNYLVTKFKAFKKLLSHSELNELDKEKKIASLEKMLVDKHIEFEEYKRKQVKKHSNVILNELLHLDDETINFVCETRLKPFLKMHKNKITNKDLIQKQKLTRKM